VGRGG
jgi:hypothetical protein